MRVFRLTQSGLVQDTQPVPQIDAGEALIRVRLAGICSTDLELARGYFSFEGVLGHEFVGVVEQSVESHWVGKRVVSSINFADPQTPEYAEFGLEHHPKRTVLGILGHDGAMADYVKVPIANLYPVPKSVPDPVAVFTEPLAAALRIYQQIAVAPTTRVAVLGAGKLGMLIGAVLGMNGAEVTVLGRSESSLALPARWGLKTGLAANQADNSFGMVVDATGNPEGLSTAIRLTRPLGTIVLKSTFAGDQQVDLTKVVVDEIRIVGSRCGPFAPALRLLQSQRIDVQSMIDGEYPIEEAMEAMRHAAQPGVRKILLNLDG